MNKKIVSFGDSFIRGTELQDNDDCSKAWPGLIAQRLNVDYQTCGIIACGNESIARQVYEYFSTNSKEKTLAVINWTWGMRWDFYLPEKNSWITLGPTCVPSRLQIFLTDAEAQRLIRFYQDYTGARDEWNHFRSLQAMWGVINFLEQNNIPAVHTYMDREIFSKKNHGDRVEHYMSYRDTSWPVVDTESDIDKLPEHILVELNQDYHREKVPAYISNLQDLVVGSMQTWNNDTFLEWSYRHNYPVTPMPAEHPLEPAHDAAADFWQEKYAQLLNQL